MHACGESYIDRSFLVLDILKGAQSTMVTQAKKVHGGE